MKYSNSKLDDLVGVFLGLIIGIPLLIGGYAFIASLNINDWKIIFGAGMGIGMVFFGLLFLGIATGFIFDIKKKTKRKNSFKPQTNN